jgi:hypothetical protein
MINSTFTLFQTKYALLDMPDARLFEQLAFEVSQPV